MTAEKVPATPPKPSRGDGRLVAPRTRASVSQQKRELVEFFDLHGAPGHLLRRCHSRARAIFDELIGKRTGLSKQQMALLIAIAHRPSACHAQLSEETGFDRNTLADTLNRLIAKGLAVRENSPHDARAYEIRLTPQGRAQLEEVIPLSYEVQAKIIEPIPAEMRGAFLHCLRLLAGVEAAVGDGADADEATALPPQRDLKKRRNVGS